MSSLPTVSATAAPIPAAPAGAAGGQGQTPRVMSQEEFDRYRASLGQRLVNVASMPAVPASAAGAATGAAAPGGAAPAPIPAAGVQQFQQQQIIPQQQQQFVQPPQQVLLPGGVFPGQPQLQQQEPGVLYGAMVSCNCLGVWMFVRLNNLPVRLQEIDLAKGETRTEEFLKMNPVHCIPTYRSANGYALWESGAILRFLCNINPSLAAWYPFDPYVRGKIDVALDWRQTTLYPVTSKLGYSHLFGTTWFPWSDEADNATIAKLDELWKTLRYFLGGLPFIGGNSPSIADCSVVAALKLIDVRSDIVVPDDVQAYVSRVERLLPPRLYKEVWSAYDGFAASKKGGKLTQ